MDDSQNNQNTLANSSAPVQPIAPVSPAPIDQGVVQPNTSPSQIQDIPISTPPSETASAPVTQSAPAPTPSSSAANYNPLNPSVVAPISSVPAGTTMDVAPPPSQDPVKSPTETAAASPIAPEDDKKPISTLSQANAPPTSDQAVESESKKPQNRRKIGIIAAIILVLIIDLYAALDSGLIPNNLKLPIDLFKKQQTTQTISNAISLPDGFVDYEISGASIKIAYPAVWGTPATELEKGYTKRSSLLNSDGTFAYLVTFSKNSDVTVVATSSSYLPTTRDSSLFYDYLQWCNGGAGAYYQSLLKFSSAGGVQTATAPSCDQGPLRGVTKIDSNTIQRSNVSGVGDLYDKNLNSTDIPVVHVRDSSGKNTANIKLLLTNTQVL